MTQQLVCLNGTFIPYEHASVAINDGAFLFGDSLFETMKAKEQKILLQWQHLDRLEQAARLIGMPFDRDRVERCLQQIRESLTAPISRLRITLSRGSFSGLKWPATSQAQFLITASPYQELTDEDRSAGATCVSAPNQRVNPLNHLPQMKRGNYADCLYAANYAQQSGAREALFFDDQLNVLEGATTNLFAFVDDRLITPPAGTLILDGIVRREVIHAAAELGLLVVERDLLQEELLGAGEAFLTNSLIDILPVTRIDGHELERGQCWVTLLETLRIRIGA